MVGVKIERLQAEDGSRRRWKIGESKKKGEERKLARSCGNGVWVGRWEGKGLSRVRGRLLVGQGKILSSDPETHNPQDQTKSGENEMK